MTVGLHEGPLVPHGTSACNVALSQSVSQGLYCSENKEVLFVWLYTVSAIVRKKTYTHSHTRLDQLWACFLQCFIALSSPTPTEATVYAAAAHKKASFPMLKAHAKNRTVCEAFYTRFLSSRTITTTLQHHKVKRGATRLFLSVFSLSTSEKEIDRMYEML